MRLINLDKLPQYEGVIIPEDGLGIYGVRTKVVKVEDLEAIEDRRCEDCAWKRRTFDNTKACYCYKHAVEKSPDDFCSYWATSII